MGIWEKNVENHITVPWNKTCNLTATYALDDSGNSFTTFPNSFIDNGNGIHTLSHAFNEIGRYTILVSDSISGLSTYVQINVVIGDGTQEDVIILSNGWRAIT